MALYEPDFFIAWHSAGFWEGAPQRGESGEWVSREQGRNASLLLMVPLRNLIASVLFHLIGFNPVIKANSDLRAGKSDSISSWGVTGSHCRRSCGMGDIFVANFGKYNLPQSPCCLVHICSLYYSTYFVWMFLLLFLVLLLIFINLKFFYEINIACLVSFLVIFARYIFFDSFIFPSFLRFYFRLVF